jgi:AcrR family transcriptional regulator
MNKKTRDLRLERKLDREERNRKIIISVAEDVFVRKGFNATSMDDIAAEAQFSKATLYRYFKSKSDIFKNIILNSFREVQKNVTSILERDETASDKLKEYVHFVLSYYQKKENIIRIFFMETCVLEKIFDIDISKLHTKAVKIAYVPPELKPVMEQIIDSVSQMIQEGIDNKEFTRVDPKEASLVLGALIRGLSFRLASFSQEASLEENTELIMNHFLYGVKRK